MIVNPKAFTKDKRKGLILFFIVALILAWFFFLGGDEVVSDLSTGTGTPSGNGNGDTDTTDDPTDIDDPDSLSEELLCTLSDADRIAPSGSYSETYSVANAETMSCSIEHRVINVGAGVVRWTFYDSDGSISVDIDDSDATTYGNPDIIYNVDSGTWQVAIENTGDTTVSFQYTIKVYGYV